MDTRWKDNLQNKQASGSPYKSSINYIHLGFYENNDTEMFWGD